MPTRPISLPIAAALLAIGIAAPGGAQESRSELTPAEWRCTQETARRAMDYAGDVSDCVLECEIASRTDPLRFCGPFSFDVETRFCLSRASTRPKVGMLRRCAAEACPDCYSGGTCSSFHDFVLSNAEFETAQRVQSLACDDGASPDGTASSEQRCVERLAKASHKLQEQLRKCFQTCHGQRQRGRVSTEACDANALDGNGADEKLQLCVDKARIRFLRSCVACDDPPECWGTQSPPLDCPEALRRVESGWLPQTESLFCVDRPVCGDGFVSGSEECDPGNFPAGCGADDFCNDECACEPFPVCGDGVVTAFELCDPTATPTGCASDELCLDCFQCRADVCGRATPVGADGGTFSGTTSGATTTASNCGGSGPEDVYAWTPDRSGLARAETCGSSYDTVLHVRRAVCDSRSREIACNDDACFSSSRVSFTVQAGVTYYLFVDGFGGGSGPYQLRITPPGMIYGSAQRAFLQHKTGLLE